MSDIVWSLKPGNESFEQLQNRMQDFAAMILSPRNIQYEFMTSGDLQQLRLKNEQNRNLYLIYKEALYNMVKYADCNKAEITLTRQENNLIMIIQDDGKGFATSEDSPHELRSFEPYIGGNGVRNMKIRANDLQANISIHSKKHEGTTVHLVIPILTSINGTTISGI